MCQQVLEELFASLQNLENIIGETKRALSGSNSPRADLVQRLNCYEEVLLKQKTLAGALKQHIVNQDWDQVRRHVELIRGSSVLIQLDSECIITALQSGKKAEQSGDFHD